jgi:hypothetical protein
MSAGAPSSISSRPTAAASPPWRSGVGRGLNYRDNLGGTRIVERAQQYGIDDAEDRAGDADRQPEDDEHDAVNSGFAIYNRTANRTSCQIECMRRSRCRFSHTCVVRHR